VTGRVPAVQPYLDDAHVMLAPLRIGGGVKVKVLEALRRGKAIVTTPVGAQGFGERSPESMRLAADPASFAAAVVELLTSRRERRRLERAALDLGGSLPTWDAAAGRLSVAYRSLLAARTSPGRLAFRRSARAFAAAGRS
jgi:glycosyltransferase involved in cell wall biosynthesis